MGRRSREKAARRRPDAPAPPRAPAGAREAPALPLAADTAALVPWHEIWRADGRAFVVLFAVALAFRLAVLLETARTPFLEVTNIDSTSYHEWARDIVAHGWTPTRTFYQSPFYAYFLALIYRLAGDGPWAPRLAQIVVGSVTPVFAYAIGTRLFTRRVGWIAGLAVALYGVLVLEEVTLSKTSLLVVAALGGMAAYLRYGPGAHAGGLAVAGTCFGLAVVGVAQWLLPFAVLAAYLPWLATGRPTRARGLAAGAFLGAGLVVLAPVVAWNSFNGGGLVLTSGGAGLNLYEGNNERTTGLAAPPAGLRDIPEYEEEDARKLAERAVGRPLSPAEVDRYWSSQAWAFVRNHPGAWLALLGRKLTVLWNAYEIPDNYHYAFMREQFIPALRGGVTLAVVGPLALVGMAMPFWRRRGVLAFTLAWAAYMVTPLAYYVRGRYRLPLAPFLAVLAGVGVERLVRAVAARRWDHASALAAGLVAATVVVNHRYCEPPHHGYDRLCFAGDIWYDQEWLKLAGWYQQHDDLDAALVALERAGENSAPRSVGQVTFWRADVERLKGEQLAASGDRDGARRHLGVARDGFRRCVDLPYRADAASHQLGRIDEQLARLE
jgi:4-amino-4-deoxy-L-arabinose transferase-like glycosyltransferase